MNKKKDKKEMRYRLSVGELIDRISISNIKIWHLEQAISEAKKQGKKIKVSEMALQVRELNRDRSDLREEINIVMNDKKLGTNKIEYVNIGRGK